MGIRLAPKALSWILPSRRRLLWNRLLGSWAMASAHPLSYFEPNAYTKPDIPRHSVPSCR
jgi:hypothetical protein